MKIFVATARLVTATLLTMQSLAPAASSSRAAVHLAAAAEAIKQSPDGDVVALATVCNTYLPAYKAYHEIDEEKIAALQAAPSKEIALAHWLSLFSPGNAEDEEIFRIPAELQHKLMKQQELDAAAGRQAFLPEDNPILAFAYETMRVWRQEAASLSGLLGYWEAEDAAGLPADDFAKRQTRHNRIAVRLQAYTLGFIAPDSRGLPLRLLLACWASQLKHYNAMRENAIALGCYDLERLRERLALSCSIPKE